MAPRSQLDTFVRGTTSTPAPRYNSPSGPVSYPPTGGGGSSAPSLPRSPAPTNFPALPGLSGLFNPTALPSLATGVATHYIPGSAIPQEATAPGARTTSPLPAPASPLPGAYGRRSPVSNLIHKRPRSGYASTGAGPGGNLAGNAFSGPTFTQAPVDLGGGGPPATNAGGGGGGGGYGGGGGFPNIGGDPGYMQALADEQNQMAQLQAAEQAAEERALIDFGDPGAAAAFGITGLDPQTGALIQQNMASGNAVLARLGHGNDLAKQAIINRLAGRGMLFSGDTGYLEGEQARGYGNQQYDARQKLQDYLTQLQQSYNDRRMSLRQSVQAALQAAYYNALQGGSGYAGGGGGGSGGGGGGGSGLGWASGYAPTYNGVRFVPGSVEHNGEVTTQNGVKGQFVKFVDPTGRQAGDTIWVPMG